MECDHSWSVQLAIQKQIEKEDWIGWALKEEVKEEVRAPLPSQAWKPSYGFAVQIIRYVMP